MENERNWLFRIGKISDPDLNLVHMCSMPESIGPILKVQVWHNNSGISPSWFLSRIVVHDLVTGVCTHVLAFQSHLTWLKWTSTSNRRNASSVADVMYHCINGKWLAVDKTDGKIEREIATSEKGVGFWKVLTAKGAQYFADYHLWCSIMTRPAFSALSRVHRVTCCLCLLLAYMTVASFWCQQQRLDVSLQFEFSCSVDIGKRWYVLIVVDVVFVCVAVSRRNESVGSVVACSRGGRGY